MIKRTKSASATPRILLLLLVLGAFGFYLAFMERTIQYDEAYTLRHFAVSPVLALLSYTEPNNHMLHSLLVWLMTTLAGQSLIAVRFVAFAMALLSLALIFRVGTKIGGWTVGIAAAVLLGTNWTFADYAVNARGYTLSIFLTLALIDLVVLSRPRRTRGYLYRLLLICAALMLTLPTMAFLIAAVILWLLWRARTTRVYRALLPPIVFGSVMGALFYLPSVLNGTFSRNAGRFGYSSLDTLFSEWLTSIFGTPVIGYGLIVLFIGGLVLLVLRRRRQIFLQAGLGILAFTLLEALVQFAVTHHTFYGRNYFYLLPIVCLISAFGLSAVRPNMALGAALLAVVIALGVLPPFLSRETEVDQVLERFDALLQPGDMILVGNFADEPIFYAMQARGEWDRLQLTADKKRLIIVTEAGDDEPALIATYQLGAYLQDCHVSDDPRWLPFSVDECGFVSR